MTDEVLAWAKKESAIKKGLDFSSVKLLTLIEGKCVQIMHHGSYDDEPATITKMHQFIAKNDLGLDFSDQRRHHEIYLSNPQRTKLENLKTIIRLPVKEKKMKMTKKVTPRLVMAILSAGMLSFLGIFDETATSVTFPILTRDFAITTDQVQWVNTLVLLVIATIVPISSQIRLRIPTKKIFILGVSLFILCLLIDIVTPWFDLLLVGRAFQGIGTGIGLPLMYNIILAEVPKEKLGFMMGIGTMITACAVAFGPVFGGIVTDALNWRWIFIISLFLIVISLLTGIYSIRQINPLQKVKIKYGQWLSFAVALVCLMLSFTRIAKYSFLSVPVLGFLVLGIISLLIWLKYLGPIRKP
ncbi:hypothetical protein LAYK3_05640 [Lactobacillus amylovorus subsp. amylovorus]|nr:hypothetical protein LAYK3_05640 [Lactobacillus amylovorus]GMM20950.1 hypothetical protein LAYK10_02520 [Lactobacillus amylovorus]